MGKRWPALPLCPRAQSDLWPATRLPPSLPATCPLFPPEKRLLRVVFIFSKENWRAPRNDALGSSKVVSSVTVARHKHSRLVSPHEGAPYEPGDETFITAPTEAVAVMTVVRVA